MISYELGFYSHLIPDTLRDPWIGLSCVGIESRPTADYYFDNSERNLDAYLFQYTLRGYGIYEAGGIQYTMSPGKGFFIHLPEPEKYYKPAVSPGEPWEFIFVMIYGENVRKYYEYITEKAGNVLEINVRAKSIQTMLNIFEQAKLGNLSQPFYCSELVYRLLCQLAQDVSYSETAWSAKTRAAVSIMEQRYDTLDGISYIADLLNVSPSHLTRSFTKETGVAPVKYLTNIRLTNAVRLLHETSLSVREVSERCGFSSANYFAKAFRKQMRLSPLEFRNQWK